MKVTLNNLDLWRIDDSLYCKRSDGHLTHIQSDHTDLLIKVIRHIGQCGELVPPYDEELTPECFSDIVRFLLDNNILEEVPETEKKERTIGFTGPEDVFKTLPSYLSTDNYDIHFEKVRDATDLPGLNLLLVIAPVFDNYGELKVLSDASYRIGLPLFYSAFGPTTFTLGPLSVPQLDTPSLNCYIRRKVTNLKSPEMYATFIRSEVKEHVTASRVTDYPYFEAGMTLLRIETDRFLRHHGNMSYQLMGKSYTYDFTRFTVEESCVLKDPLSPLFTPNAPFTPFNG